MGDHVGFKDSGVVRVAEEAAFYLALAYEIMGEGWVNPGHFCFGTSSLLGSLLTVLGQETMLDKNEY